MPRPLKFRVFDSVCKNWLKELVIPTVYSENDSQYVGVCFDSYPIKNSADSDYVNRFIHQQFTGLVDKNGVEIYEGDILATRCVNYYGNNEPYSRYYLIEWSNGKTFDFNGHEYSHLITGFTSTLIKSDREDEKYREGNEVTGIGRAHEFENCGTNGCLICEETEVVGNIFENPELIKL